MCDHDIAGQWDRPATVLGACPDGCESAAASCCDGPEIQLSGYQHCPLARLFCLSGVWHLVGAMLASVVQAWQFSNVIVPGVVAGRTAQFGLKSKMLSVRIFTVPDSYPTLLPFTILVYISD